MEVNGLKLSSDNLTLAVDFVLNRAELRVACDIHLVNAYTLVLADGDSNLGVCLRMSHLNLIDSFWLVAFGRLKGASVNQVRGADLLRGVLGYSEGRDIRHFFLGSTEATLARIREQVNRLFPHALIVGAYSPPFRELTDSDDLITDSLIRASGANLVWVGLGTPKQDFEAQRLAAKLSVTAVAVGAAFDFLAGSKSEAPTWVSRIGLEWLFRLLTEPRRLWKRYFFGNLHFVGILIRELRLAVCRRSR